MKSRKYFLQYAKDNGLTMAGMHLPAPGIQIVFSKLVLTGGVSSPSVDFSKVFGRFIGEGFFPYLRSFSQAGFPGLGMLHIVFLNNCRP